MSTVFDSKQCPGNLTPADDYDGDLGQCSTCAQWVSMFTEGPRKGLIGFHFIPRMLKLKCEDCLLVSETYNGWGVDLPQQCDGSRHRWQLQVRNIE